MNYSGPVGSPAAYTVAVSNSDTGNTFTYSSATGKIVKS
jgi:hypothetical protein